MCPGTANKSLSQNQAFLKNGPAPHQPFSEQKLVRGSGQNGGVGLSERGILGADPTLGKLYKGSFSEC